MVVVTVRDEWWVMDDGDGAVQAVTLFMSGEAAPFGVIYFSEQHQSGSSILYTTLVSIASSYRLHPTNPGHAEYSPEAGAERRQERLLILLYDRGSSSASSSQLRHPLV